MSAAALVNPCPSTAHRHFLHRATYTSSAGTPQFHLPGTYILPGQIYVRPKCPGERFPPIKMFLRFDERGHTLCVRSDVSLDIVHDGGVGARLSVDSNCQELSVRATGTLVHVGIGDTPLLLLRVFPSPVMDLSTTSIFPSGSIAWDTQGDEMDLGTSHEVVDALCQINAAEPPFLAGMCTGLRIAHPDMKLDADDEDHVRYWTFLSPAGLFSTSSLRQAMVRAAVFPGFR